MGLLVSIDTGGTLTDICAFDGARSFHAKTLTTPHDLSECLINGLEALAEITHGPNQLDELIADIEHIRYSTTQGTNAIVQRKGPRLGLIADNQKLIDDVAALNPELYGALVGDRTAVFAPETEDRAMIAQTTDLVARGANRLVIIFSGLDAAAREAAVKRTLYNAFPRHLLGAAPLLFGHDLAHRGEPSTIAWTALLNAFLHPSMEQFLYNAEEKLRRYRNRNPLLIYGNDGRSRRVAKTIALSTYSSGPRGGVSGVEALCRHHGLVSAVSIDIGGTTTDIACVRDGAIAEDAEGFVEGVKVAAALARIDSVGAGGSSILRVVDGAIVVGPDSVGSAPGPACFGRGGDRATITDALAVCGLFNPETFFGGRLRLDVSRAAAAMTREIAEPLGLPLLDATQLAIDAYDKKVAAAIERSSGGAPIGQWLIAFGGAGPMSACGIAEKAEIQNILIPRLAAVFSAFGISFSDVRQVYTAPAGGDMRAIEAALSEQARRGMNAEGFSFAECDVSLFGASAANGAATRRLIKNDADADAAGAEWFELEVVKPMPKPSLARETGLRKSEPKPVAVRAGLGDWPVFTLESLKPGAAGEGPCLIEEAYFTTWVKPGWRFRIGASGDIFLSR